MCPVVLQQLVGQEGTTKTKALPSGSSQPGVRNFTPNFPRILKELNNGVKSTALCL